MNDNAQTQMGFGGGPKWALVPDPNGIWSRTQMGFGPRPKWETTAKRRKYIRQSIFKILESQIGTIAEFSGVFSVLAREGWSKL